MIGEHNSSITRVRPVFQGLIRKDQLGLLWLPRILRLATKNKSFALKLADNTGRIFPGLMKKRIYADWILRTYGIDKIELKECFEKILPPPSRFLRWLIENPKRMTWPNDNESKFGPTAQEHRENLFGKHGSAAQNDTRTKAIKELGRHGGSKSYRQWWAFEGFTEVDCFLETDRLILLIEGKRKEPLSPATNWYPKRNQLIRNLEVAQEICKGKDFAVMLISEKKMDSIKDEVIEQSLPHFSQPERHELMSHYLGNVLWKDLCVATDIRYQELPNTTEEVAAKMKV